MDRCKSVTDADSHRFIGKNRVACSCIFCTLFHGTVQTDSVGIIYPPVWMTFIYPLV